MMHLSWTKDVSATLYVCGKTLGRKKGYKKSTVEESSHVIGDSTRLDKAE
jgi:hypothetical protein